MIGDILVKIAKGDLLTQEEARELLEWGNSVQNAPDLFGQLFKGLSSISTISQITQDLGTVNRGAFISGNNGDPLDISGNNPFTGVAMMAPGIPVLNGGDEASIFGMNEGRLSFWLSNLTGKIKAGQGAVELNDEGILIPSVGDAIVFYDSQFKQYSTISLTKNPNFTGLVLSLQTWSLLSETNQISNGDFETGDLTDWTETDVDDVISIASDGYNSQHCVLFSNSTHATNNRISQSLGETCTNGIVIKFKAKISNGVADILFYDGSGNYLTSAEELNNSEWLTFYRVYVGSVSDIRITATCAVGDVYIDDIEIFKLWSYGKIDLGYIGIEMTFNNSFRVKDTSGKRLLEYIKSYGVFDINTDNLDTDFVVKGTTDSALIYSDAGNNRVGIGDSTPSYKLDVDGDVNVSSGSVYRINGEPISDGDGWIPVSETWTRTGNHTFTVSGDLTAKYRKGTKIRYRDGGSDEYGVIGSSSHSGGTTTVTLITNSDYAMAAATITNTYLSYIENPAGFPGIFNFALSVSSGITIGDATVEATWQATRNRLSVAGRIVFGSTTSISGDVSLNLPIAGIVPPNNALMNIGFTTLRDASPAATYNGSAMLGSSSTVIVRVFRSSGTYVDLAALSSTLPFTWTTNDQILFNYNYLF